MVNSQNLIDGISIDAHPLADQEGTTLGVYSKVATVLATQAMQPGIIKTPEGQMRFHAGDYIVTDNPPTHAWPVKQQVFEATYLKVTDPPGGALPVQIPASVQRAKIAAAQTKGQQAMKKAADKAKAAGKVAKVADNPTRVPGVADSASLGVLAGEPDASGDTQP